MLAQRAKRACVTAKATENGRNRANRPYNQATQLCPNAEWALSAIKKTGFPEVSKCTKLTARRMQRALTCPAERTKYLFCSRFFSGSDASTSVDTAAISQHNP